jgi:hypothetical protein
MVKQRPAVRNECVEERAAASDVDELMSALVRVAAAFFALELKVATASAHLDGPD